MGVHLGSCTAVLNLSRTPPLLEKDDPLLRKAVEFQSYAELDFPARGENLVPDDGRQVRREQGAHPLKALLMLRCPDQAVQGQLGDVAVRRDRLASRQVTEVRGRGRGICLAPPSRRYPRVRRSPQSLRRQPEFLTTMSVSPLMSPLNCVLGKNSMSAW